jgi:hypothetical protein
MSAIQHNVQPERFGQVILPLIKAWHGMSGMALRSRARNLGVTVAVSGMLRSGVEVNMTTAAGRHFDTEQHRTLRNPYEGSVISCDRNTASMIEVHAAIAAVHYGTDQRCTLYSRHDRDQDSMAHGEITINPCRPTVCQSRDGRKVHEA